MLSRHAEVLFWVGRYLQRAAQTGQLVSITAMSQVERHDSSEPWTELLEVLYLDRAFADRHGEVTPEGVIEFLVLDRENPGSIASSVASAREGLRHVRDLVPLDLLEAVNVGHAAIRATSVEQLTRDPVLFLDELSVRSERIAGVIHDSMVRSDGYRFLVVGRYLERAEMTLRAVDVNRRAAGSDVQSWVRILRSVNGLHAFLHANSALGNADDIVRFLVTGANAPCCVRFCLNRCEEELKIAYAGMPQSSAVRSLGRLRAKIEFDDVPGVTDPTLDEYIDDAEVGIRDVSDCLRRDLFDAPSIDLHAYEVV